MEIELAVIFPVNIEDFEIASSVLVDKVPDWVKGIRRSIFPPLERVPLFTKDEESSPIRVILPSIEMDWLVIKVVFSPRQIVKSGTCGSSCVIGAFKVIRKFGLSR